MNTLLIENGHIITMNEDARVYAPGWVWIKDDRIELVGEGVAPNGLRERALRRIDATHMAVLPGLVNAHTHLGQTFMRGLGDDKSLLAWLKQVMWPLQAAMTPEDMRLATLLGLVENLHAGVTAVNQHHKLPNPVFADATLVAAQTVGLRLQLARAWVDMGAAAEEPSAILAELRRLYEQWQGAASGRLTVANGPIAPWRCSDETMRETVALARSWGIPTHIHVAEAQAEVDLLQERTGLRHIEWLEALAVLGQDTQLVHSIHVSEHELDLIAAADAMVVYCPTSNMYLASGIAPVAAMLRRNISIALGTDGSASHNSQDLLETLKTGVLLAKTGSHDPTVITPLQALHMITSAGARILRRNDVGQLIPGFKADLTLIDLNTAHAMPVHSAASAVVYNCNGPDVHTVIVDGRILLDAGEVTMLDEAALLEECRQAAQSLLHRAGV